MAEAKAAEKHDAGLVEVLPAANLWRQAEPHQRGRFWRWFTGAAPLEPPASFARPVEDPVQDAEEARTGVCCSGGGIRSASFNLGVLQALQKEKRFQEIKYLAAVSGGSYIASAIAMVAKTWDPGKPDPPGDDSDPTLVTEKNPPFHDGSPEEQYLRNRASYMAPTGVDKLYLVWRIFLGLLVNLLLIGAALALVATALSAYYYATQEGLLFAAPGDLRAQPHEVVWVSALGVVGLGVLVGMLSVVIIGADGLRRFLEVWSLRLVAFGLLVFTIEMLLPAVVDAVKSGRDAAPETTATAVGGGLSASLASLVGAVLLQVRTRLETPKESAETAKKWVDSLGERARVAVVYLAAAVLGPLLLLAIFVGFLLFQLEASNMTAALVAVGAAIVGGILVMLGDLTSWSLHPFYRRRLCTAFALKRVPGEDGTPARAVERRQGELVPLSQTGVVPRGDGWSSTKWPTLVVCAAANISDPGATPPGRAVTSFTFSPHTMGGPLVGGVDTSEFEQAAKRRQHDFTLPAVVAMSGAALSPSMGKMTRSSLRFLMALANVRLGVWVANPRRRESFVRMRTALVTSEGTSTGDKAKAALCVPMSRISEEARRAALRRAPAKVVAGPRPSPYYLLKELFGRNSVNDRFLYITDGGHYENLGLVELLRRGCTKIYCFDASGGARFAALGDAIALARSELGVHITFPREELERLTPDASGVAAQACATGTIEYTRLRDGSSASVDGRIVYVPTVMTADAPWDVHAFRASDPAFPNHSTADQLFTDQKFEAYRMLGACAGKSAIAAMDAGGAVAEGPAPPPPPPPPATNGAEETLRAAAKQLVLRMLTRQQTGERASPS